MARQNTDTMKLFIPMILLAWTFQSCGGPDRSAEIRQIDQRSEYLHEWYNALTDAIMTDAFTPPVGARIYTYSHIAYYEIMRLTKPDSFQSYAGQLREFEMIPEPKMENSISFQVAAIHCYYLLGKELVYTQKPIIELHDKQMAEFKKKLGEDVVMASQKYGEKVYEHMSSWMNRDQYKMLKTPQYSHWVQMKPEEHPEVWQKTPPSYLDAVEPNWELLRPMVIDSAAQFDVQDPTAFSTDTNSRFYKECMEVYTTVNELNAEQKRIAEFWDCNPNILVSQGHASYFLKKLSPGGHWMSISSIVSKKEGLGPLETAEAMSLCAIGLFDGFISCWKTKYRTNLIRPETYINRYIDKDWRPILETPPFPEYTSGHSVISRSAAAMMTHLFGDNYAFTDSTEVQFGLSVRSFDSFVQASEEAAVSRLYGGIHYRLACDVGLVQGKKISDYILENVNTRK